MANDASSIKAEIKAIETKEYLVGSNEGTFSGTEAVRAVGTAQPEFCTVRVYETVGGRRRWTGPSADSAPGMVRYWTPDDLRRDRSRLAELKAQIARDGR